MFVQNIVFPEFCNAWAIFEAQNSCPAETDITRRKKISEPHFAPSRAKLMNLTAEISHYECISFFLFAGGMRKQQRRSAGTEKLKKVGKALKRKFEQTLQVELPTPESTPPKRQKQDSDELAR